MFFGLTNSPSTFQEMMNIIYKEVIEKHAARGTTVKVGRLWCPTWMMGGFILMSMAEECKNWTISKSVQQSKGINTQGEVTR
jgi:hypothetical protein